METPTRCPRSTGFALVITLALMILLRLLAVGLLMLSSISLRAAAQGTVMATARANARLALMLALGELQKCGGRDQRVTARADLLDESIANPRLTGVWNSWEIKATAPPAAAAYEKSARDAKFQGWLVSGSDPLETRQIGFASLAPSSPVTLWGKGSLGDRAAVDNFVRASKVGLASSPSNPPGAVAWALLDEGIKARINTHDADDATSAGTKTLELGAGECAGAEFIPGLNGLERKFFDKNSPQAATLDKGISRLNFALAGDALAPGKGVREALISLTHDVTTHSLGLFTDTVHGGLKQDFQLLTNSSSLPAGYAGKGVYVSRLGLTAATAPSDPRWESFQQFARLYRDKITDAGGVPLIKAQTPGAWAAAYQLGTTTTVNVKQVRLRGPFLSLAEFVNRGLGSGDTAQRGALQQAIDDSNLNPALALAANAGFEIPAAAVTHYKYNNPAAGGGPSYQGAAGYLTQADLLNVLGNAATPRSDTFTICGYGETRDAQGKVLARATCEALVQRFPEWLDPADPVATAIKNLQSRSSIIFDRRFLIASFRWLHSNDI